MMMMTTTIFGKRTTTCTAWRRLQVLLLLMAVMMSHVVVFVTAWVVIVPRRNPRAAMTTMTTQTSKRASSTQDNVDATTETKTTTATSKTTTTTTESGLTYEDEQVLFGEGLYDPNDDSSSSSSNNNKNNSQDNNIVTSDRAPHRIQDRFGNVLNDPTTQLSSMLSSSPSNLLHATSNPLMNKLNTMRDTLQSCPALWLEMAKHCPDQRAILDEHLCDTKVDWTFGDMANLVQKSARVFDDLLSSSSSQEEKGPTAVSNTSNNNNNNNKTNKGKHVAVLGENSAQWLLIDQGLQLMGGVSAVRGADAPTDELRYIYEHSDSAGIAVLQGPKLVQKLHQDAVKLQLSSPLGLSNAKYGPVRTVVLMHREKKTQEQIQELEQQTGVKIVVFADLLEQASPLERLPALTRGDLSTIVYTSGTTGRPKGVMLTHGNLLHQTGHRLAPSRPMEESEPVPGDVTISLLPVWHITERTFELWMASRGCTIVYSTIRTFKNDLAKHKPQWLVLVPRVLEKIAQGVQDKFASGGPAVKVLSKFFTAVGNQVSKRRKISQGLVVISEDEMNQEFMGPSSLQKLVSRAIVLVLTPLNALGNKLVWSKVQDGFGGRIKVIISGGSALAGALETFYETAGLTICVGYGLTECSPLLTFRRSDRNLVTAGCAGLPCLDTQVRIVDPEGKVEKGRPRPSLPIGQAGVILGKGPQVMKGYYKNEEATSKAIDEFGWFDTGDLGRINPLTGDLILTGRAKDTIVLSNGENIEPTPIEDAILGESALIDQIMLTGQDGRRLVAVVVLNPAEVGSLGYVDEASSKKLQAANEKANDPKCTQEDCAEASRILNEAATSLRKHAALKQQLMSDMARATKAFRNWEQVGDVYVTLEPFCMANGLLTQSYKVKRAQVIERFQDELAQLK